MANNDLLVQSGLQTVQNNVTSQPKPVVQPPVSADVVSTSPVQDLSALTKSLEQQQEQQQQQSDALQEKVTQLNDYMQNLNRSLQFTVDQNSGDPVVKVIDSETDEVVRQIPSEELLKAREAVDHYRGILLETKV